MIGELGVRLYLVQHGEAKREEEDPLRPLTERGKAEVEEIAKFLAEAGIKVERILHSGKLRASQTAEILGRYLKPPKGIKATDGLEPMADPRIWAERLEKLDEDLMLVGHLPHLRKLASLLLVGRDDLEIVRFRYGGVVCLERDENNLWSLIWFIRPEIIPPQT